jgi:hypothetical protein
MNLVARRRPDKPDWVRLQPDEATVAPDDELVALPGYRSQLRFDSGAGLYLWGNLPSLLPIPLSLLESDVVLHPPGEADLDFTLGRGRVVVSNDKPNGPVKVRVRFDEEKPKPAEVWELTLDEPGTEIGIDLAGTYTSDTPFKKAGPNVQPERPTVLLFLVVLRGHAQVKADANVYSVRAPSLMSWDNNGPGVRPPTPFDAAGMKAWDKAMSQKESTKDDTLALKELLVRLSDKQPVELVVKESLQSDKPASRSLAVYSLAALGAVSRVLDALADDDERQFEVRGTAIEALRHWIGRGVENDRGLYTVMVSEKHYTSDQAETVMQLLHGIPREELAQPATWETLIDDLRSSRPAVRTLAYWHLWRLVPEGREPKYNPAGGSKQLELAYQNWKKLVPEGQLPPGLKQPK